MTLISRITQLIRANLNDLIDKAEDPEKMVKQVVLDMEEELKELKGQIAISMADKNLLEKQSKENRDKMAEWLHKAELCVAKDEEPLARSALERYIGYQQLAGDFEEQLTEQNRHVGDLKGLLQQLEQKLIDARAAGELLLTQQRRAHSLSKIGGAGSTGGEKPIEQLRQKVNHAEAVGRARISLEAESTEHRVDRLEKDEKIDKLLAEIKARRKVDKPSE